MERDSAQIRADLEDARAQLVASMNEVRVEVARTVDWRRWYLRSPGAFIVGAFTLGLVLGSRRSGR